MKKNLFVLLLTTFTAGSMLADEDRGFIGTLGANVKGIIESPAHIGQSGKKRSGKKRDSDESSSPESQSEMKRSKSDREENSSKTKKSRRSRRRSNEGTTSNRE